MASGMRELWINELPMYCQRQVWNDLYKRRVCMLICQRQILLVIKGTGYISLYHSHANVLASWHSGKYMKVTNISLPLSSYTHTVVSVVQVMCISKQGRRIYTCKFGQEWKKFITVAGPRRRSRLAAKPDSQVHLRDGFANAIKHP